jgi:hypothetical protein
MTVKQYSFPSEEIAKEMILELVSEDNELPFNKITVTEKTHGIAILGFQHKYELNVDTEESVLIQEATTYDVDVMWKGRSGYGWSAYEVHPKTPNHKFA